MLRFILTAILILGLLCKNLFAQADYSDDAAVWISLNLEKK